MFLALFLALYLRRNRNSSSGRDSVEDHSCLSGRRGRRLVLVLILANVVANNPIANPRYRFGGVLVALALVVVSIGTPKRFRLAIFSFLGLLLFVYPYAAVFRYDQRSLQLTSLREQLVNSVDYGMFQQEMNGVVYVRSAGHTYGRQALGAALAFVPRKIWKDKPIQTGDLTSRSSFINASSSLWEEAYVDAGRAGIFVVFLIYGWLSRVCDSLYQQRRRGSPTVIGAAVPLFAAFQTFVLRGSLQPAVGELAPLVVVFCCCIRVRDEVQVSESSSVSSASG